MSVGTDPSTGFEQHPDEIRAFWELAKRHAKLDNMPGYFGPTVIGSVPPPAFALANDPDEATAAAQAVLSGAKTVITTVLADLRADELGLPEPGTLGIVLDGHGHPHALVATTEVGVVPFGRIPETLAIAEAVGDGTFEDWTARQAAYFTSHDPHGRGFSDDTELVVERFKRVYPKKPT